MSVEQDVAWLVEQAHRRRIVVPREVTDVTASEVTRGLLYSLHGVSGEPDDTYIVVRLSSGGYVSAPVTHVPHATLSDSTTQTIAATNTAYPVTFNTNDEVDGITHSTSVNPSRVTIVTPGSYVISAMVIADLTGGAAETLDLWLSINGSNVANSRTIARLPNSNTETPLTYTATLDFNAGDYFEIVMRGSSTNLRLLASAAAATPTRPAAPSARLAVHYVGTHN